jgi:hypothetical protein
MMATSTFSPPDRVCPTFGGLTTGIDAQQVGVVELAASLVPLSFMRTAAG